MRPFTPALAWGLVLAASATAQTPLQPLHLHVVEPAGCEDHGRFERAFRAQNPEVQLVAADRAARELRVRVERHGAAVVGHLEMIERDGETDQREISGESCAEVIDALVLVASVLASAAAPAEAPVLAPAPSTTAAPASPEPAVPPPSGLGVQIAVGATLAVAAGALPGVAPQPRAFVGAELAAPGELAVSSARASFAYASATANAETIEAGFQSITARAEYCGPRLGTLALAGEACASMELGQIQAEAEGVVPPFGRRESEWLAAGVLARALCRVEGGLRVEVEGGASFPMIRPDFFVEQTDGTQLALFRTPGVGGFVAFSVGLSFP